MERPFAPLPVAGDYHPIQATRGAPDLKVTVVPDSGTDQLTGISGSMTIDIVDGKHLYGFEYSLAPKP